MVPDYVAADASGERPVVVFSVRGLVPDVIREDRRLRRVLRFVRRHLTETIRLEDAARVACLSRTYFSTYFRRRTGLGFHYWLEGLRVARAEQLMLTSELNLTEVAFDAGFGDVRTFQRAFRRHRGRCPSAWRRRTASSRDLC